MADPPYDSVVEGLMTLPRFGDGVGLHRMEALLAALPGPSPRRPRETGSSSSQARTAGDAGHPWLARLDAVRVTGSNGKGTVASMVAAILEAAGVTCGLYTSPHLRRFNERIVVGGREITDGEIADAYRWLEPVRAHYEAQFPHDRIGAFEAITALAMAHFAVKRPDTLVVEAGIGGRYDSTRVIPGRLVGLTSVDLEHTGLLGETPELIAYDKADLCPRGGTLVLGPLDPELRRRLEGYCQVRGVECVASDAVSDLRRLRSTPAGMSLDLCCEGLELTGLRLPLRGEHHAENAALAAVLAGRWLARQRPELDRHELRRTIHRGLARVRRPGQLQTVHSEPEVIVDLGHTPQAIRRVAATVRDLWSDTPLLLLTGVSQDKDRDEILRPLAPLATATIATRAHHRGTPAKLVHRSLLKLRPEIDHDQRETLEDAVALALERARRRGMKVLVAGGLFLAVEAWAVLEGEDPRDLRFL